MLQGIGILHFTKARRKFCIQVSRYCIFYVYTFNWILRVHYYNEIFLYFCKSFQNSKNSAKQTVPAAFRNIHRYEDEILHRHRTGSFGFRPRFPEEVLQIAPRQQFQDDEARVLVEAHPDEVDYVRVVELRHYQGFHQEVHFCLVCGHFREGLHCNWHLYRVA